MALSPDFIAGVNYPQSKNLFWTTFELIPPQWLNTPTLQYPAVSMTSSHKFWSCFSYFLVNWGKFICDFLSFIFSVFLLRKWNFAVILSDNRVVKNKFSTSLHHSFWRNRQGSFSIILNCEWFSSKWPRYQCPKSTFKLLLSWLPENGSSHQHCIIGKK